MSKAPRTEKASRTHGAAHASNAGANGSSHANGSGHAHGHANGSVNGHASSESLTETSMPKRKIPDVKASKKKQVVKTFVLDTNIVLHNPDAIFVFKEHDVVLPFSVIEELDKMKRKDDDLGRNARACIRNLDRLRAIGALTQGISWSELGPMAGKAFSAGPNGKTGRVRIDVRDLARPAAIGEDMPDNRIIAVAYHLMRDGHEVVFLTKDLSARIKADSLGIKTEDFQNQKVDAERLYTGFVQAEVEGSVIDELYRDRLLEVGVVAGELTDEHGNGVEEEKPLANQFVILKNKVDATHTGLARRLADTEHLIPVTGPRKPVFGIMARNVQQTMAMDVLLDEEIKFITLLGSAGTGKTLLALAAGMSKVFAEERYSKLLVARPIMPLGRDIGYLPGDKDEKLSAWMQPIFDNLTYLMNTRGGAGGGHADSHSSEQRITKLMADGKLVLEPLTYIRGRSIPQQFMIVDEAQNLTPHEVKTIASRVGDGTKLILTGDIEQIDNPYLDSSSNGLAYAVEKMKGVNLYAHVTLAKSERSELASLAASRL
jgi:PhoH-like ATPase